MSTARAERRTGWALPPQPPEQWLGRPWELALLGGLATAVLVPLLSVRGDDRDAVLFGVALAVLAAGALVTAYVLLLQSTVTGDRGLLVAAGASLAVWPLALFVVVFVDGEGRPGALRAASLALGLLALVAAARCRAAARGTAWTWVVAGLCLGALAGVLLAFPERREGQLFLAGQLALALTGLVPALGLMSGHGAGYHRQARRWRSLVSEVTDLRTSSPLLPGLSVSPEDDEGLPEEVDVRRLIDARQVDVALQPVVRLTDDAVVGFEALSRFGGRVPTDRWFRAASRCGLGGELERLTLGAALALLPTLEGELFLAVNVSPAALEDEAVLSMLRATDLTRVVVEVTEHEAVGDYAELGAVLAGLRRAGARIAVDDTGAGFASLRHVLMLQPDVVKLDTSLSHDVHHDERQQRLVRVLLGFAREVGSDVIAEGIETQEQLEALQRLGVPLGQGWHLGVPTVVT